MRLTVEGENVRTGSLLARSTDSTYLARRALEQRSSRALDVGREGGAMRRNVWLMSRDPRTRSGSCWEHALTQMVLLGVRMLQPFAGQLLSVSSDDVDRSETRFKR